MALEQDDDLYFPEEARRRLQKALQGAFLGPRPVAPDIRRAVFAFTELEM